MNNIVALPTVSGMLMTAPTKAGSKRLQLMSKRDFVAKEKAQSNCTTSEAQRKFDVYRQTTLAEFNQQLGQSFARGDIRADRITSNGNGELTTIGLVRHTRSQRDKAIAARSAYFASLPESVRSVIEAAESTALAVEKATHKETVEVSTSPVAASASAEPAAPAASAA